jgi:hypothetical protein
MGTNSTLGTAALSVPIDNIGMRGPMLKRDKRTKKNMPLNEPKSIDRQHMATLSEFMTHKDGTLFHAPDEELTQEQLLEILPNDLHR